MGGLPRAAIGPLYPAMARLLLLLSLLLPPGLVAAAESPPARSSRSVATLAAEAAAVAPGEPFRIALRLRLAPGWHTYWRNPGDAGAPPEIELTAPEAAAAGPIIWPAPERLPFGPLVNFGYSGEVLLPLTVQPPPGLAVGSRLALAAQATWLVCSDVCVPEEAAFALDLPVEAVARPDPRLAITFAAADAMAPRQPPSAPRASVGSGRLHLSWDGWGEGARDAAFFPDAGGIIDNAAAQRFTTGRLSMALAPDAAPSSIAGTLVLTAADGGRTTYAIAAPVTATAPAAGLWAALGLAFVGGLLLNLMPCVFPVLAMKAMALVRLGGAAQATVRAEALSYTAGVLATTLLLGAVLLALRAAGSAAGWGFQLTEPVFVAVLAWLMLGVGLNLSGVYRLGGTLGLGGAWAARGGHLGSFATGALAVLVATPCTAPFMATALGAALALPAGLALAVFAALGLGLAAPYAALAVAPGLAGALPRPGAWMERLRQALAFPMYGAAAWLVWVLAQQTGPGGLALALAGGVLLGFAAWALGASQDAGGRLGRRVAAAALLVAAALLPALVTTAPAARETAAIAWSAERVAALQAQGRPVFVNFTAAWCLTCLVNERAVLATDAAERAFTAAGAARLVGDWTSGDPAIGALLRSLGREGVPLYLVYPAGGGAPAVLPQILSESVLRAALIAAVPAPVLARQAGS